MGIIGFYYPDKEEEWDRICGAGFLGNFWDVSPELIELIATAPDGKRTKNSFRNAEAAFQALKFWEHAAIFKKATGSESYQLSKDASGGDVYQDRTYAGFGSNWKGMQAVLMAKFRPGTVMASALAHTGDAFLLEHNSTPGRDSIWSDNCDGEGKNWLGLQLMLVRDQIIGRSEWSAYIRGLIDVDSVDAGKPRSKSKGTEWQQTVRQATQALVQETRRRRPSCRRRGCSRPTWNGRQGEFCSKACRNAETAQPRCQRPGCHKTPWNGQQGEYCSRTCKALASKPVNTGLPAPLCNRCSRPGPQCACIER